MLVVLRAQLGGAACGRVQLRSGQSARVGSSGWVELSVPQDANLLEAHFAVACEPGGCVVRNLDPGAATLVNGEPVEAVLVFDGDEVQAGQTRFALTIEGGPARPAAEASLADAAAGGAAAAAVAVDLSGVCAHLEFPKDVQAFASAVETPDQLIDTLAEQEKYAEAFRLRAYLLGARPAVWWGCGCVGEDVGDDLPEDQVPPLDAAEDWVEDPSEENRRRAEAEAAAADHSGPGAMLALGAFWSEGSLGPVDGFASETDERMTSQAISGALIAAGYLGDPAAAEGRFRAFLERGKAVADGEDPLPDDPNYDPGQPDDEEAGAEAS